METIILENRVITYELIRKRVKNINLRIKPGGEIIVSANNRVSKRYIEEFMYRKSRWIMDALDKYEKRQKMNGEDFILKNGSFVKILGRDREVKIISSSFNKVEFLDTSILIYTKCEEEEKLKDVWEKWLLAFVKETFLTMMDILYQRFKEYPIKMPVVKVRAMKTRWGSCSVYRGCITLNKYLIHAPKECIEYVIVHELAHFMQPNHSKKFYNIVEAVMPDYKQRDLLLKKQALS